MEISAYPLHEPAVSAWHTLPRDLKKTLPPWRDDITISHCSNGFLIIQRFIAQHFSLSFLNAGVDNPYDCYIVCAKPTIVLQVSLECSVRGDHNQEASISLPDGHMAFMYVPKGTYGISVSPGKWSALYLEVPINECKLLLKARPALKELLEAYEKNSDALLVRGCLKINYLVRNAINIILSPLQAEPFLPIALYSPVMAVLLEYFTIYDKNAPQSLSTTRFYTDIIREIKQLIDDEPHIEYTLTKFAANFHLDERRLSQSFKKEVNMPIQEYLLIRVMTRARKLLRTTRCSVEDIALELGYSCMSSFSRAYNKYYGYYPSKERSNKQ